MPIVINSNLPARKILEEENIFLMTGRMADKQDIRPLKILILNLMPTKVVTETQLLRLLSNSPLQVKVKLLQTASYVSKNTPQQHFLDFYKVFDQVKDSRFDGLIITGAPVEQMPFEEVEYWPELAQILEWSKTNVYSTLHICWGAQAGLYHHYGIDKKPLQEKLFGVYPHTPAHITHAVTRGFDEVFYMPHSRHTDVSIEDAEACKELTILASSEEAGLAMAANHDNRQIFIFGHCEYDRDTLSKEYFRDVERGLPIHVPKNYFPQDDPAKEPPFTWRSHANLFFYNWLNHVVYQNTPYDLDELAPLKGRKKGNRE